ncbi:MAG: hypothetical protein J6I89_02225 [Oscillospiraceae bacterium]|nr:hypothetical protein [Oscillospiraceae bacterium]
MKKSRTITVIGIVLIAIALVGSLLLDDMVGTKISNVVTVITAVIGAAAIFIQFKKDKDFNEATFIIDYSTQFYDPYNCGDIMDELEKYRIDNTHMIDIPKYYKDIVCYLQWLESLAALINSGLLSFRKIDNVLSYRYFLIVNNPQIQEVELLPCREFYAGIMSLYKPWADYKKKHGRPIIFEETALDRRKEYQEWEA